MLTLRRDDQDAERADQGARAPDRAPRSASIPTAQIFLSLFKGPNSVITAAELLAEIGDCRAPLPRPATRSPATPARPRSRSSPASARAAVLPLGLQQAAARRVLHAWPTAPATGTPGPQTSTPPPAPAATTTPARSAPSAAPGAAIVWRCWQDRTPYDPARHRALQRHITVTIPTPSGPVPDLAATQRMAGAAVTRTGGPQGRARSA